MVDSKAFHNDDGEQLHLFSCTCIEATEQRQRHRQTNILIKGEILATFHKRESEQYCLHINAIVKLLLHNRLPPITTLATDLECGEDDELVTVDQLSSDPFVVAVFDGISCGILTTYKYRERIRLSCRICSSTVCSHVNGYKTWCEAEGLHPEPEIDIALQESRCPDDRCCKSYNPIPLPLPETLQTKYDEHRLGIRQFPEHLIPEIPMKGSNVNCKHGFVWDRRDPVKQNWIASNSAVIYDRDITVKDYRDQKGSHARRVYYRPSDGTCDCILPYDGLDDLLFNLNNNELFTVSSMITYMYHMIESRNPLAGYHRGVQRTNGTLSRGDVVSYGKLRLAWNSFIRLVDIDQNDAFKCEFCGDSPDIIICDATCIGFRKDLLVDYQKHETEKTTYMKSGSSHADRVFVSHKPTRVLLERFSGIKVKKGARGRRFITKTPAIVKKDLQALTKGLREEGNAALANIVERLCKESSKNLAPNNYSEFLYELARNNATCGTFQISGDKKAKKLLQQIASEEFDIFQSRNGKLLTYLQGSAPVMTNFLHKIQTNGKIPQDTKMLIVDILSKIDNPFAASSTFEYPPATPDILSFFPCLPQQHGNASYTADKKKAADSEKTCRKESYGHPSLSPGIFTIFCQHGVCYGFEAMVSNESPRHPFQIFKTRFAVAPRCIIYDNACQLHQYCLNREPTFFRDTKFYVDRFHWKCHVGCSVGYCLDQYKATCDVVTINSQINEQANAGLKRIRSQLAYMTLDNFMIHLSLFLGIKNIDIKRSQHADLQNLLNGFAGL